MIFRITAGSCTVAISRSRPPQCGHASTSRANPQCINKGATAGEYTLRVSNGVRLIQAHFHCGAAGVNGPVIVFLAGPRNEGWDVDGKWISNATITDANVILKTTPCGATLAQIFEAARNGNVYVNVHSVQYPAGVVRGQLEPAGDRPSLIGTSSESRSGRSQEPPGETAGLLAIARRCAARGSRASCRRRNPAEARLEGGRSGASRRLGAPRRWRPQIVAYGRVPPTPSRRR
jgi:CHRD domain-containing protein